MRPCLVLFFLLQATLAAAQSIECTQTPGLAVDADGAPDSYRVDGKGLSATCSGVFARLDGVAHTQKNDAGHWEQLCRQYWDNAQATGDYSKLKIVGFLTHNGRPVVQGDGDPLPGEAFVTTTSLTIPGVPDTAQRRYVNAREIPYVVLPAKYARSHHLNLGDLVAVYRQENKRIAYAVYGDSGDFGEASIRLHQDLGNDAIVTEPGGIRRARRGISDPVLLIALTGTHTTPALDADAWRREIRVKGEAALAALGGVDAIRGKCR
jgi:hypothetical protein